MTIEAARPKNIPAIAELLTSAFIDDPVLTEYVMRSRDPELAMTRYFTAELEKFYIPRGVVDIVREEGTLLGAALWASPERPIRKRDAMRKVPALVKALGRSFPRAVYLGSFDEAATPAFPHWYLYTIVVSPDAQGKGIGGMLLDHGIARAGTSPIYLESTTPASQRLYERKGFIALGVIPSPLGVDEIGMWRPGANAESE